MLAEVADSGHSQGPYTLQVSESAVKRVPIYTITTFFTTATSFSAVLNTEDNFLNNKFGKNHCSFSFSGILLSVFLC